MKATLASALNRTRSAVIDARLITTKRKDNRDHKNSSREQGEKKTFIFQRLETTVKTYLYIESYFSYCCCSFNVIRSARKKKLERNQNLCFSSGCLFGQRLGQGPVSRKSRNFSGALRVT